MGLISSANLIRSLSVFHLVISYFLLTNPATLAKQNLVYILSSSLHLTAPSIPLASTTTALAALALAFLSLSDFVSASELLLPPESFNALWSAQAQARLLALFGTAAYIYLTRGSVGGVGAKARNGLVFTWVFVDTVAWFWIFLALRDERRELAKKRPRT